MAFPIIPKKRSGATGSPTSLTVGELAVNTATGELFLGGDSAVLLLNPPTAAGTTATERTGDGTTTAFTFTGYNGTADGGYLVSVGGIDQPPSKYAVTSTAGGTITFVEAPTAGELISIRALVASGGGGGGGSGTVTSITAGAGLDGGTITDSGTISMPDVGTPQTAVGGGLVIPVISTDAQGRVTALTTAANPALTTTQIAGLSTTAPAALSMSAVVGLSTFAARADHQHEFPTAAQVGALGATATASGDLAGAYPAPTLAAITTAQSNVGSSTQIPVISIDAKGRVTSLSSVTAAVSYSADALIVAGGGGGGSQVSGVANAGGGGAGGLLAVPVTFTGGVSYAITVGAGGAVDTNGSNSLIGVLSTSVGGGKGGGLSSGAAGGNGGSGGGGTSSGTIGAGGSGTTGQGFAGGQGSNSGSFIGGGGGGAGAAGTSGVAGGNGGVGTSNSFSGAALFYGGGGGGGGNAGVFGAGGNGGGGRGGTNVAGSAVAGTANTGGGGGGSAASSIPAAPGGSGIVIIRYAGSQRGTGGTVTTAGGNTIHTFLTSGTFIA